MKRQAGTLRFVKWTALVAGAALASLWASPAQAGGDCYNGGGYCSPSPCSADILCGRSYSWLPYFAQPECRSLRPGWLGFGGYSPFYLPPLFVPSEQLGYGPQIGPRYVGYRAYEQPLVNIPRVDALLSTPIAAEQPAPREPRQSNAANRGRSWRYMDLGDGYFQKQRFHAAHERYKSAAVAAPDLAEVFLRQGQALIGMGRSDLAPRAFRRALELDPDWAQSTFRLDPLYAGANVVKLAHREALARLAVQQPNNADRLLLVGLNLYFDDEIDRALPFLRRAAELDGSLQEPLSALLDPQPAPPALRDALAADRPGDDI